MDQPDAPLKIGVVFIGRRRPGFDMDWGRAMEDRVRSRLKKSGFAIVEPGEKAVDEGSLRRSLAACGAKKIDVARSVRDGTSQRSRRIRDPVIPDDIEVAVDVDAGHVLWNREAIEVIAAEPLKIFDDVQEVAGRPILRLRDDL